MRRTLRRVRALVRRWPIRTQVAMLAAALLIAGIVIGSHTGAGAGRQPATSYSPQGIPVLPTSTTP